MAAARLFDFRLLGPLEVLAGGHPLPLGPPKQRALLALLLLRPNEALSSAALIEALWPADPPRTADTALHGYVSALRKTLGRDRVETRSGSYAIRVEPEERDLDRLEKLLAEAREAEPDRAAAALREGLGLFRGAPLSDVGDAPGLDAERTRLEDVRLTAVEARVDADLAGGAAAALVPELEALVHANPFRERLRGQLMVALYRSGRQADALEAYTSGRRRLGEELGLEPGAELKALQARILAHDPALAARPAGESVTAAPAASAPRRAEQPPAASRRVVTVIFTDIVESSGVTERLDPEALRNVLRDYFATAAAALERHGGVVEKFIGDAVMAVFGVPRVEEDDALRAVRAAVDLRGSLVRLSDELEAAFGVRVRTRIGVNTGEVVVGDPKVDGTLATGEAVVVARRLEQQAGPDEILVGATTYDLVRDAVVAEPAGRLALKGLSAPLHAWRVLDVIPAAAGVRRNFDAPLVDRERERAFLADALGRAVEGNRCELVTVLGAPGIGKTRLASEFRSSLSEEALVLEGRCLSYGEGITFWPVREIVRRAAGIAPDDTTADARRKIAALVPDGEAPGRAAEAVASAIGLAAEGPPTDEIFLALRRTFERLASERPLVLVFEDINWAAPGLLDLLEYLAGWSRAAPILLLCLARPDLLDVRPSWAATTILALDPLGEGDMRTLIANAAGHDAAAVAARVGEFAEGNPLFAEEMVRMLLDAGELDAVASRALDPASLEVPPTIHALLAARLDRLEPDERTIIGCASVIGRQFGWTGVTELAPPPLRTRVAPSLQALVRKRMVIPDEPTALGEDAFRFSHILMQDAAYRALPRSLVAELHERFADWLARRAGDRAGEYAEILGYHLERAAAARRQIAPRDQHARRLAERAGTLLASAGTRALAREDVPAATSLLERAVVLLADEPEALFAALLDLGAALRESGELARAEGVLERAIEHADALGRDDLLARAEIERSSFRAFVDPALGASDLLAVAEGAIAGFERAGDDLGLTKAWIHVAEVHWMRCRCGEMETVLERAIVHADRAGSRRDVSWILGSLARALLLGPRPVAEAIERCVAIRERGRGDRVVEAYADSAQCVMEAMLGRADESRRLYARVQDSLAEVGLNVLAASVLMYAGFAEHINGDDAAAARELARGYEALERMGELSYLSTMAAYLGRSNALLDRFDDAERFAEVSRRSASLDDLASQIVWRGTAARVRARRGLAGAEELALEGVELAARTDFVNVQADALVDLGAVRAALGLATGAATAYDQAVALYHAKGNGVSAERAGALRLDAPGAA